MSKPVDVATIDIEAIFTRAGGHISTDKPNTVVVNDWKKTAVVEKRKKFDDEEGEIVE